MLFSGIFLHNNLSFGFFFFFPWFLEDYPHDLPLVTSIVGSRIFWMTRIVKSFLDDKVYLFLDQRSSLG